MKKIEISREDFLERARFVAKKNSWYMKQYEHRAYEDKTIWTDVYFVFMKPHPRARTEAARATWGKFNTDPEGFTWDDWLFQPMKRSK